MKRKREYDNVKKVEEKSKESKRRQRGKMGGGRRENSFVEANGWG